MVTAGLCLLLFLSVIGIVLGILLIIGVGGTNGNGLQESVARIAGDTVGGHGPSANNYRAILLIILSLFVSVLAAKEIFDHSVLDKLVVQGYNKAKENAPGIIDSTIRCFLSLPGMSYGMSGGRNSEVVPPPSPPSPPPSPPSPPPSPPSPPQIEYPRLWILWLAILLWIYTIPYTFLSGREELEEKMEAIFERLVSLRRGGVSQTPTTATSTTTASLDGGWRELLREGAFGILAAKLFGGK